MKKNFLKISLLLIILNIFSTLLGINLKPVYAATANNPPIINIESPTNNLSGVVTIQGYILSDYDPSTFGLMTSSVYIDGASADSMSNLKTSISREDLKKKYPNYKYAGTGGFSYKLDTGKLSNGNHKIKFKFKEIEKEIVISVKNNPPIINIESPTNNLSGVVTIQGYILSDYDPSTFGFMTSWVYIDGALADSMSNLKTSISREDLKKKYPNYKYAETGGFSYKLDTGKLSNGNHKVKFNFNGIEKEIVISIKNNPPIINIESPTNNLSGVVTIQGCVLSDYDPSTFGFMTSHVYIDGAITDSLGDLKTSISREDLKKKYPDYKYAGTGGFSYKLDTGKLSNGNHKIKFKFNEKVEKEVVISVKNNPSIINIESPTNNLSGVVTIQGCVLSDYDPSTFGLMTSWVYIDGVLSNSLGNLKTSISREDLKKKYPDYKYAGTGGFSYNLDTTKLLNGNHKVKFKFNEIEKEIVISVINNQEPTINIESPNSLQNISGNIKISGYILSDFDPFNGGILGKNVYLDGENYYEGKLEESISREDLKNKYPNYKYAGTGGFSYNLDTTKLSNGSHKIKFNFNGIEKELDISVNNNNPPIINIESPVDMNNLTGIVTIKGYVLSNHKISVYNVFIDEKKCTIGNDLKTSIIREDLKSKYSNYKYAGTEGFSYNLDTTKLSNGSHKVRFNFNGIEKEIVISVKNNPSVINIESPTNNLSGVVTIQGCVLSDYDPSTFGFMNSNVYVDGALTDSLSNLKTSISREDLKKKYPDYKYAGTGGFSYKLDTGKLSNGNHKIKFKFNEKVEKEIVISVKNNPPIINIESPTNLENLSGVVTIQGYVLSDYDPSTFGLMTSWVYIDGALTDSLSNLKTSISREDLKKKYPDYKYAGTGGFSYELDTVILKNGKHKLKFDINGITKEIDISVNNYKQELVIDKIDNLKAQQGFMKLTGYIVSGYNNVSNFDYNIYIDDVKVNHCIFDFHCNLPREDLKDKYPYCKDVTKGGFKYILDTRTLKNGDHKIKIKFKDTESSIDFKVDNSNYNNSLDNSDDITFEEAMKRASEGSKQVNEVIQQMIEGLNRANEGMAQMNEAFNQIKETVVPALNEALEGMNQMIEAINQINKTVVDMTLAVNKSVKAMNQMNEAINKMNAAINQMNSGVDDINGFISISIDTLNDMNKALDKTNAEIAKLKLARNNGNARDIDWSGFDLKIKEYTDLSSKVNQSIMDKTMNYLADAIKHMIGGKYNDSINTLGIVGDFAIAFFGADLPADIRDLSHDIKYWQWSWGHAAETTLDAVGLVPVIGAIKYGDEVGLIVKDAEKGVETIKLKGGIKGAAEAAWKLPTLKKIPYEFMNDTVEHIFKGVVKNAGTADVSASGWHYLGKINPPGNKIIQVINEADEFGTIIAKVDIDGVAKKGFSSFFSNKYTPDEVVNMIMEAHMNKKLVPNTKGCYRGVANNGMTIEMYLYRNADGSNIADIITAYPVHTSTLK